MSQNRAAVHKVGNVQVAQGDLAGALTRTNGRVPSGVKTVPISLWKDRFYKGVGCTAARF